MAQPSTRRQFDRDFEPSRTPVTAEQPWFDKVIAVAAGWLAAGFFVDGWAHAHGKADSTFFTPWHAVFYSGFAAVVLSLAAALVQRKRQGRMPTWLGALPRGHSLAWLGIGVFGCAGVGDLIWHTLFGIEKSVSAIYSPTHIMLASGAFLMLGAPFRAAWLRPASIDGRSQAPWSALLSLIWMFSIGTFATHLSHPLVELWGGNKIPGTTEGVSQAFGILGMLWDTSFLLAFLLFAMRRWTLPVGAVALIIGLNAVAVGFLNRGDYPLVPVITRIVAAFGAEAVYFWLRPSPQRRAAWRLFAVIVPVLLTTLHFAMVWMTTGVSWTVHLWAGTIVLTGLAGLLMSVLVVPEEWPGRAPELRQATM